MTMKIQSIVGGAAALLLVLSAGAGLHAQEKKAEKAKAQKVAGDIGLLDTEKNYMIVVTKEGKLVTLDYTNKTKVTALVPSKAKMSDIGLGSAASVQYTEKGGKNYLTAIEFIAAKGE
jgi:hypothetical protein